MLLIGGVEQPHRGRWALQRPRCDKVAARTVAPRVQRGVPAPQAYGTGRSVRRRLASFRALGTCDGRSGRRRPSPASRAGAPVVRTGRSRRSTPRSLAGACVPASRRPFSPPPVATGCARRPRTRRPGTTDRGAGSRPEAEHTARAREGIQRGSNRMKAVQAAPRTSAGPELGPEAPAMGDGVPDSVRPEFVESRVQNLAAPIRVSSFDLDRRGAATSWRAEPDVTGVVAPRRDIQGVFPKQTGAVRRPLEIVATPATRKTATRKGSLWPGERDPQARSVERRAGCAPGVPLRDPASVSASIRASFSTTTPVVETSARGSASSRGPCRMTRGRAPARNGPSRCGAASCTTRPAVGRAEDEPAAGELGARDARKAEVENLQGAVLAHETVVRLEVAVRDAPRVAEREPCRHAAHEGQLAGDRHVLVVLFGADRRGSAPACSSMTMYARPPSSRRS